MASIYGLVLLFIALMTGLVKLPQVHEAARFLIEIMPLMFIPAGVGLIDSWGELRPILLPVLFCCSFLPYWLWACQDRLHSR